MSDSVRVLQLERGALAVVLCISIESEMLGPFVDLKRLSQVSKILARDQKLLKSAFMDADKLTKHTCLVEYKHDLAQNLLLQVAAQVI